MMNQKIFEVDNENISGLSESVLDQVVDQSSKVKPEAKIMFEIYSHCFLS